MPTGIGVYELAAVLFYRVPKTWSKRLLLREGLREATVRSLQTERDYIDLLQNLQPSEEFYLMALKLSALSPRSRDLSAHPRLMAAVEASRQQCVDQILGQAPTPTPPKLQPRTLWDHLDD